MYVFMIYTHTCTCVSLNFCSAKRRDGANKTIHIYVYVRIRREKRCEIELARGVCIRNEQNIEYASWRRERAKCLPESNWKKKKYCLVYNIRAADHPSNIIAFAGPLQLSPTNVAYAYIFYSDFGQLSLLLLFKIEFIVWRYIQYIYIYIRKVGRSEKI